MAAPIDLKPLQGLKPAAGGCLAPLGTHRAPIDLKPLQGLKPCAAVEWHRRPPAPIDLKPLQGLKPLSPIHPHTQGVAPIDLKPLQGLKPSRRYRWGDRALGANRPQTLTGIETRSAYTR